MKGTLTLTLIIGGLLAGVFAFAQQPPSTGSSAIDDDHLVQELVQQAVQIGGMQNAEDRATLYAQMGDAVVSHLERQVRAGRFESLPSLTAAHQVAMQASYNHQDIAMQIGRNPSKALEAVKQSAEKQIPVLTNLQARVPVVMQSALARSLDTSNHGRIVSSQRLAAIQAWKASGQKGPPPWAGVGGGPGGNPNYPGQGKDIGHGASGGAPGQSSHGRGHQ